MDVGQKLRRMKHNLVNSSKKDDDEDLKAISFLEHRNSKVINAISSYKKNVAATIRTGLKEENIDKRKKKLDEFILAADLKEAAAELEQVHTTCLHKVMRKISHVLQIIVEERVKHDLMVERRVLEDLTQFQEMERALTKSREKLANAYTDLDIAQKSLEKADGATAAHQEAVDSAQLKLENYKDNTITDVYMLATREQEIAKNFAAFLEEQFEYHRTAMTELQKILPEVRRDIDNARPRPVFGVDLAEHLRHYQTRFAIVIEKCCSMLRKTGFTEKGLFRVNGNNSKIRRMKAAFDAGQIELDEKSLMMDPNSVCSVLKSYLRELPDSLLTGRLQNEWISAIKLDGEARLRALESCIASLPKANFDNLTYLMHFLSDLLQHQDVTAMTASNLAIVMGPNLMGCDLDGNNANGTKVVEMLLLNAPRLFGIPDSGTVMKKSLEDLTSRPIRNDSLRHSVCNSKISRPKEKAPPPPKVHTRETTPEATLIDLSDDWSSNASLDMKSSCEKNHSNDSIIKDRVLEHEKLQTRRYPSFDSDDYGGDELSADISAGSMSRSMTEKPLRPPLPSMRQQNDALVQGRPISYHMAVGANANTMSSEQTSAPSPPQRQRVSMVVSNPLATRSPSIRNNTSMTSSVIVDAANRTVVNVDGSASQRIKPPLPVKPKPDLADKETSRL